MPAKKLMLSIAIASMIVLPVGMAQAGDLEIQTGNVQMSLGRNSGVSIKTYPTSRSRIQKNRRLRSYRSNRQLKCQRISRQINSNRGGNQIYSSATTTTCN